MTVDQDERDPRGARRVVRLVRRLQRVAGGGAAPPADPGHRASRGPRPPLTTVAADEDWHVPGLADLLTDLDDALCAGPRPPRVAVFVRDGSLPWAALVRTSFPRARVVVLDPAAQDSEAVHARLAAGGRYHAVVDDTLLEDHRVDDLERVFLHLRKGGVLLVRRPVPSVGAEQTLRTPGDDTATWSRLAGEVRARAPEVAEVPRGPSWPAFPEGVAEVRLGSGHVVVVNRIKAYAKLREHQMDQVIEARDLPTARVLTRLPPTELTSRCTLRHNADVRDPAMPETYAVPAMALRRYSDVLCAPRQVAVQGNLLLPDTYRFNAAPTLQNRFAPDLGHDFADLRARTKGAKRLEGAYFYLDSEWTGHFGHALTEQLSRLWAADRARQEEPGLRALVSRRNSRTGLAEYEREIFGAAGFAERDIVLHHRPVRVEALLGASPMWALPTHVHPDLPDLWRTIGGRIAARAQAGDTPRRIFCSRRMSRRMCRNLGEVEALFERHGFAVVHPEEMAFVDQVEMFRQAEVIAGFAGSAMFTSMFCPTPRHLIVLGPTSYPSRNEYMISAAAGHRLDHVWSEPDPEEAAGEQPQYAGFRFDFAREGQFLEGVLADL